MENLLYPAATFDIGKKREQLAPEMLNSWRAFSRQVFADGALPAKTKDLIAIAVAHVTQCPYCIRAHTKSALQKGATEKEIMEAIWVAAEMRAGAAIAHSALAIDVMKEHSGIRIGDRYYTFYSERSHDIGDSLGFLNEK